MSSTRGVRGRGLPEIEEGASLGELIAARAEIETGDVLVISQKIVSKAEGRLAGSARSSPAPKRASSPPYSARSRPWSS